jgi:acyl carrier protein
MSDESADRGPQPPVRERLLRLVEQVLSKPGSARSLALDARLSELGMSSVAMVHLMLAVEVEFAISIPQSDITPENFRSVTSVEALVERLLALTP